MHNVISINLIAACLLFVACRQDDVGEQRSELSRGWDNNSTHHHPLPPVRIEPIGPAAASWPMLGRTRGHDALGMFAGPTEASQAWSFDSHEDNRAGAVIGPTGTIYTTGDCSIFAIQSDGTQSFAFQAHGEIVGPPAIAAEAVLLFGTRAGHFYALDGATGKQLWKRDFQHAVSSPTTIADDGTILVGVERELVALKGRDVKWTFKAKHDIVMAPVADAIGNVYFGTDSGHLYGLDPKGRQRWKRNFDGHPLSTPVLGKEHLYVGTGKSCGRRAEDYGKLYAVKPHDGNTAWTFRSSGAITAGVALGEGHKLYFGAHDGNVYALTDSGRSFATLWSVNVGGAVRASAAVGRTGTVYVGSDEKEVKALDGADGHELWSQEIGAAVRSPIAIGPGDRLYVGADDSRLHALGAFREGEDCWEQAFLSVEGLSLEESVRRFQVLLASCAGPGAKPCRTFVQGESNADRVIAANRLKDRLMTPQVYLAVMRDRTRKIRAARDNETRACELLMHDADKDLVPDSQDDCPNTPPLTATTDNGCTDPTTPVLPDGVTPELVWDYLAKVNIVHDRNCTEAEVPNLSPPAGAFFFPSKPEKGETIRVIPVSNQPAGCSLFYEIQALRRIPGAPPKNYYLVLRSTRGNLIRPDLLEFRLLPDDPGVYGEWGREVKPTDGGGVIVYRARTTNGAGAQSRWSEFRQPSFEDCLPGECGR